MTRSPRRRRRHSPLVWALYLNAGLLGAILLVLVSRESGVGSVAMAGPPPAVAQPIAGGNGLYLMPGQFSPNVWGCYVMDVERQTLFAYEYLPPQKQLRLVTARHFAHDRQLMNYNTTPAPEEIERIVQLQNQAVRGEPGDVTKSDTPLQNGQPRSGDPTTGEAGNGLPSNVPPGLNGTGPIGPNPVGTTPEGRPLDRPPQPGDADYVPKPSDINNGNPG